MNKYVHVDSSSGDLRVPFESKKSPPDCPVYQQP